MLLVAADLAALVDDSVSGYSDALLAMLLAEDLLVVRAGVRLSVGHDSLAEHAANSLYSKWSP